ncbi:hypothetical protein BVRB_9g215690 isoform C [Beta vulgaris subsp. vulgaris]|nr:hypothetical protein BVRB_9g215690 isoform C [Beta vulgaris subsp. vulgaris]
MYGLTCAFMGGVEDGQPPTKRLRLSCAGSSNLFSGLRAEEQPAAARSLRDLMARPIQCQGEEEVIGSRGVIKKLEFVRLIAGALYALGYERSGACLEEESGIPLQSVAVNLLMQHVLDGRWDESASILQSIGVEDETIVKTAKFLILEQNFFELLDDGKTMDALKTLRTEISPLHIKTSRMHELSSCILYHSQSQNGFACRDSMKGKLRSEVLDELQKIASSYNNDWEMSFILTITAEETISLVVLCRLDSDSSGVLVMGRTQTSATILHSIFREKTIGISEDREIDWGKKILQKRYLALVFGVPKQSKGLISVPPAKILGHQDEVWYLQFFHNGCAYTTYHTCNT